MEEKSISDLLNLSNKTAVNLLLSFHLEAALVDPQEVAWEAISKVLVVMQ